MKENRIRRLLDNGLPSVATRVESTWPTIIEVIGATGKYDYVEFVGEYAPYSLADFEHMARAAELHGMGTMIKVDFQNRAYVAQKALSFGFQSVLLTDHKTPDEVRESLRVLKPDCPEDCGRFGYPNSRWSGYQPYGSQKEYARMLRGAVIAVMIEKQEAMDNIDEICAIPGVDMVQFGPSDYSLSRGWDMADHRDELMQTENRMIEAARKGQVHPRCEIYSVDDAKRYADLGVRHFCIGDEMKILHTYWSQAGAGMRALLESTEPA